MSEEKRSFSRIEVRLKALARTMQSIESPQLFTGDTADFSTSGNDLFSKSKLPEELVSFLTEMDRKLDRVISLLTQDQVRTDFSMDIEVTEISGAGLKFRSKEQFDPGQPLEILLYLSQAPLRLAGSKGCILEKEQATGIYRFEFVDMRGSDMEAIVQFVFKEQREQIRNAKM